MARTKRRTGHETVRAHITINVALNARWSAAAALARIDRSEFAVLALEEACRGLFVTDRRKPADRGKASDRLDPAMELKLDDPEDVA
jgi:hypothetical protein